MSYYIIQEYKNKIISGNLVYLWDMSEGKKDRRIREFIKSELNELSRGAILLRSGIVLTVAVVVAFSFALLSMSNPNMEMPKTLVLRAANSRWKTKLEMLEYKLDQCEEVLLAVENRNEGVYREMFGLGSTPEPLYPAVTAAQHDKDLSKVLLRMDSLTVRIVNQNESLDQLAQFARRVGALATAIPSIPPILPRSGSYYVSSFFGSREDPVYGDRRFHSGIDLSTRMGTPVYATGDGTVEIAERQYYGYGNMVVINHGYGYRTRYAHLKKMFVEPGQYVRKGELIGQVGRTGKATGPHLHYEVSQRGRTVNPLNFMDLSMSIADYREILLPEKKKQ